MGYDRLCSSAYATQEETVITGDLVEVKRLGKGNPVSRYLGAKGLGCFLSGSYAGTEQRGGMLGYVQSDDEQI